MTSPRHPCDVIVTHGKFQVQIYLLSFFIRKYTKIRILSCLHWFSSLARSVSERWAKLPQKPNILPSRGPKGLIEWTFI